MIGANAERQVVVTVIEMRDISNNMPAPDNPAVENAKRYIMGKLNNRVPTKRRGILIAAKNICSFPT
jgi:hypothetical protein